MKFYWEGDLNPISGERFSSFHYHQPTLHSFIRLKILILISRPLSSHIISLNHSRPFSTLKVNPIKSNTRELNKKRTSPSLADSEKIESDLKYLHTILLFCYFIRWKNLVGSSSFNIKTLGHQETLLWQHQTRSFVFS